LHRFEKMPPVIPSKSTFNKPVRLQDVARAAGTSLATASLALNDKGRVSPATRRKILRIARRMGFEANPSAQGLAAGHRSKQIIIFTRDLDLGVATRKLQILQGMFFEKGYNASIHSCGYFHGEHGDDAVLIRELRRQRPLAIICHNTHHFDQDMFDEVEKYAASGGHLVTFDLPSVLKCDQVVFDRTDSADQAATHLLQLGHREIGFAMPGIHKDIIRTEGIIRALQRFRLPLQPEFLFDCQLGLSNELTGESLAQSFLQSKRRPTAICIPDDTVAVSFIATLYRQGIRIPKDLSVVGHDDLPIAAHNFIPLSTVSQPLEVIARETVNLLMSRVDGSYDGAPRTVRLCGELIPRESTAILPNGAS
jgi:DNA-binding LacI/PurR family transcriptional regulator